MTHLKIMISLVMTLGLLSGCAASSLSGDCQADSDCPDDVTCLDGRCVLVPEDTPDSNMPMADASVPDAAMADSTVATPDATPDTSAPDAPIVTRPPPRDPACTMPSCNRCADRFPTAVVCESFDAPLSAPWTQGDNGRATVNRTTARYASGGGGVQVHSDPDGYASFRRSISPAITSGTVHVRLYTFLPPGPDVSDWAVMVNLSDIASGRKVSLDVAAGDRAQATAGPMGESVRGLPNSIPRDQWVCLELRADLGTGGGTGNLSVYADGVELYSVRSPLVHAGGGFDNLWVGLRASSGNSGPIDAYMDELVVSTDGPIGCGDVMFADSPS